MKNRYLTVLALFTLSGCTAPAGPQYTPHPAPKLFAKLVIYRPQGSIIMSGRGAPAISINGTKRCNIDDGRFFTADVPGGTTELSTRLIADIFTSKYLVDAKAGSITYVKVTFNDPAVYSQMAGGALVSAAVSQEGTFRFMPGSEMEAKLTFETCSR